MTATAPPAGGPQEALEFRGNSHSPASPKPLHFPSPANIPILEKSMDPTFSETMMQNMHPNTFPSMAQHTINAVVAPTDPVVNNDSDQAENIGQLSADSAIGRDSVSSGQDVHSVEQSAPSDSQDNAANQSFLQGTQSSPHVTSEAVDATSSDAEPVPGADLELPVDSSTTSTATQAPVNLATEGGVDTAPEPSNLDAFLANFAQTRPQPTTTEATFPPTPQTTTSNDNDTAVLPPNPNLPPKPPAQEKPMTHPNYTPGDDIRSYHPHSQKDVAAPYRTAQPLSNIVTNGLPPPPHAYQTPMSATMTMQNPEYGYRDGTPMSSGAEEDAPFDPQLQQKFDAYIAFEKQKTAEGQWDQFPPGSRLFIGNLPTEKASKRDVFRRFHIYGLIAQISLKNAFGFVQYLNADACYRAVDGEQGKPIRGREMHLEVSKPQKHGASRGVRRSRSPDYNRGGRAGLQHPPRNVDRYSSNMQLSPRDRDYRRQRDDYRPARSPSPRGYRSDRYDDRRRSRSRSPYSRDNGRRRSPPRRELDDDLPLPRRTPADVPDIQILASEDLNIQFVQWVEKSLQDRGLRAQVLLLTARLPEAAVVRRQIVEGVQAIVKLTRYHEQRAKIPVQIFDRRGGVDNLRFEQYEDLDPQVVVELVLRAKQTHAAPTYPSYGQPAQPPQYGIPPAYGYGQPPPSAQRGPPPPVSNANVANIFSSLGVPNALSNPDIARLLANPQQQQQQQQQSEISPDIARILGQLNQGGQPPIPQPQHYQQMPQQGYAQPQLPPAAGNPYGAPQYRGPQHYAPPVAPVQQQQPPQQPPAPTPANLDQILAGLTAYRPPA